MPTIFTRFTTLFFVSIALMIGIWYQSCGYFSTLAALMFLPLFGLIFFAADRKQCAISLICVCSAFFIGTFRYHQQQNNFYVFYTKYGNEPHDIIGTILSREPSSNEHFRSCITLDINKIKKSTHKKWEPENKKIYIYTNTYSKLITSNVIMLKNISFKKPANQSFNTYLMREGCAATLFITPLHYTFIKKPSYSFYRWITQRRNNLLYSLKKKLSKDTYKLFATIFLGNPVEKRNINETKYNFKAWGIMHYLARSGLHLVLFILLWHLLLRFLPIPYTLKQIILVCITIVYSLLSWASIPFTRAFITLILYKFGTIARFQTSLLHLLSIICLFTLLNNPMQLFFLDFQLSFCLTGALACFNVIHD